MHSQAEPIQGLSRIAADSWIPVTFSCGPVVGGFIASCAAVMVVAAAWAHVAIVQGYRVAARGEEVVQPRQEAREAIRTNADDNRADVRENASDNSAAKTSARQGSK